MHPELHVSGSALWRIYSLGGHRYLLIILFGTCFVKAPRLEQTRILALLSLVLPYAQKSLAGRATRVEDKTSSVGAVLLIYLQHMGGDVPCLEP